MEDHFEENDLVEYKAKFMGLTYTRLGEVYYYYGIAQATVELYKNALLYFNRTHNYNLANTYRHIGGSYRYYNNNDSALHYYREAIRLAKKTE
jgi:tetratricopeptide (TPR) repeat protein